MKIQVAVVPTGTANLASVFAALERVGASATIVESDREILKAERLVVPGVGNFSAAMKSLRSQGFTTALRDRYESGKSTLSICLGLQLLCENSEESPGEIGLQIIKQSVVQFSEELRRPQFGWNNITPEKNARLLQPGYAWFANSFKLNEIPEGWSGATAEYGSKFVAAIERGSQLSCQFHPELSGVWGLQLINRWLQA